MTQYQLSDEDHRDLADAFDQDKELRWLERDRSRAQSALLAAAADVDDETLRALQLEFAESRDRLERSKKEIVDRLMPQFHTRARARLRGSNAVVFTPAEESQLTLPERHELMTGTRRNTLAFELKDIAQERLRHHGWNPEHAQGQRQSVAEASPDALPLPSPRQWCVYATVAAIVGTDVSRVAGPASA
jgi:hypothetical protein